jgi:1-pyrroline-5-carboxylate dehydrogenase
MTEIYQNQPISSPGIWNRMEYRPLEGFTYAITPFNFTSIAANLCAAPVMISDTILSHPDFSGLHFTGSTHVFKLLWKQIGENINKYKTYPRIVGETGGKDFIWAHASADAFQVATAITRGAFEYQGQKCSAASRAYIPKSLWNKVKKHVVEQVESMKVGSPDDTSNFVNAVIHEASFDKISNHIDQAKTDKDAEIIVGRRHDKSKGYFIEPTVILAKYAKYTTMCTELFGPVITIYVYEDIDWKESLITVDNTSEYALTGAIFSGDRYIIDYATNALENAAGNFYINDKPTGAVVGQQPFGGARGSGTNDKAGSVWNLLRWVSNRTIKETFVTPTDYKYPFLEQ